MVLDILFFAVGLWRARVDRGWWGGSEEGRRGEGEKQKGRRGEGEKGRGGAGSLVREACACLCTWSSWYDGEVQAEQEPGASQVSSRL